MMLAVLLALVGSLAPALGKVEVMQYGQYGGLTLVCGRGELILVESEQLGYSETDGECNPRPMCSVPYTLARLISIYHTSFSNSLSGEILI